MNKKSFYEVTDNFLKFKSVSNGPVVNLHGGNAELWLFCWIARKGKDLVGSAENRPIQEPVSLRARKDVQIGHSKGLVWVFMENVQIF